MKPEKKILDACCGGKMFYFDKHDPRVLFMDIRRIPKQVIYEKTGGGNRQTFEIDPDVQADFADMPFEDERFSLVVFDPPHLTHSTDTALLGLKYGSLDSRSPAWAGLWRNTEDGDLYGDDWREMLRMGFSECFRVLKHGGFLIFKWSDIHVPVGEILSLTPQKPILGHRSGRKSNTHWILFMKD